MVSVSVRRMVSGLRPAWKGRLLPPLTYREWYDGSVLDSMCDDMFFPRKARLLNVRSRVLAYNLPMMSVLVKERNYQD